MCSSHCASSVFMFVLLIPLLTILFACPGFACLAFSPQSYTSVTLALFVDV